MTFISRRDLLMRAAALGAAGRPFQGRHEGDGGDARDDPGDPERVALHELHEHAAFALVLNHTHQGTFGDPYYGGNANFVGWDLVGYPGVRTMVTSEDQQKLQRNELKPNHKSAYDYDGFTKSRARATGAVPWPRS